MYSTCKCKNTHELYIILVHVKISLLKKDDIVNTAYIHLTPADLLKPYMVSWSRNRTTILNGHSYRNAVIIHYYHCHSFGNNRVDPNSVVYCSVSAALGVNTTGSDIH